MMKGRTLRFRMMVLFCSVVGVLLAASYLAFWGILAHEVSAQINRRLLETARPIIADIITEPNAKDVDRLDIPGEFFELLEPAGQVLQHSKNLTTPIDMKDLKPSIAGPVFGIAAIGSGETVHIAFIPFQQGNQPRILAVAIPTFGTNRVLDNFGRVALLLFLLSLLLTAVISAFYVGRSLKPVVALTQHAALMAKRVTNREGFWTVLHGETELLLSKPRSAEEYQTTLSVLDDEFKKLTRIVEGLFTLSMADAGQLHLACEPLYINEVLEEACALGTSRARTKNIVIVRDLSQEIAYSGDEAFLHELFLIFLDNAIKYSPDDTQIRVTLEQQEGMIRARFEDQGIGISSEHLSRIFERFYRAAPSSNGDAHSGGLGLAIAQAIARAQGGTIECRSVLGAGSTFMVTLPVENSTEGSTGTAT